MKKITLIALSIAAVLGCTQKENITPENSSSRTFNLTVSVDLPQMAPTTKVAFDAAGQFEWTGNETATLIFGKSGSNNSNNPVLQSISPGVFGGEVTAPEGFTIDDLQGIVVPSGNGPDFRGNHGTHKERLRMYVDNPQTNGGEVDWDNCPFFVALKKDDLTETAANTYTVSDLKLRSAVDLIRYNVYGKHPEMNEAEVLKSVAITGGLLFGTFEYNIGNGGFGTNGTAAPSVVNYSGNATIADKTKENGIKLFQSINLGGKRTVTLVQVVTDKAEYTKTISMEIPIKGIDSLNVYQIGINLANGYERLSTEVNYSVDGGANWSSNIPTLNGQLAVKTLGDAKLTEELLKQIKSAIDQASAPVALDLSQAEYEAVLFPAVFTGTSSAKNTKLKSIKFPSNVTQIAAKAFSYCAALESVDLSGITTINSKAFYYSGLKTLNVPKTVSSFPGYLAFGCCADLTEVYFDSPAKQIGGNGSSGTNHTTFAFTSINEETGGSLNKVSMPAGDCVFTFGPNSAAATRYFFRYNLNVKKIVFTKNISVVNYCFQYMENMHTFDFSTVTTVSSNSYSGYWNNVGKQQLIAGVKCQILVPKGCKDAYAAKQPWKDLITNTYDTGKKDADGKAIMSAAWEIVEVE